MMRHICFWALLLLYLTPLCASAVSLPECTTAQQVMQLLLLPEQAQDGSVLPCGVEKGAIRYISQSQRKDPAFCEDYWLGGEKGGDLDLTIKTGHFGKTYTYYCANMCTRAAYSMALSALGIDLTPGDMSRLTGMRHLVDPYDDLSALVGVSCLTGRAEDLAGMYLRYAEDPAHYSPVYIYLLKPSGQYHALLLVAKDVDGRYLAVDPNIHFLNDMPICVYTLVFSKDCREIINGTLRAEYAGTTVLRAYQWKLAQ